MRFPEGREDFRRYFESAVEIPSPATDLLGTTAKENKIYLVIGVIERELGTLYCTICFFSPRGELLGKHRNLNKIPEGKYDLDTPGHYARPDVFQLQVNLRKQNIVTAWDAKLKDPFEN